MRKKERKLMKTSDNEILELSSASPVCLEFQDQQPTKLLNGIPSSKSSGTISSEKLDKHECRSDYRIHTE